MEKDYESMRDSLTSRRWAIERAAKSRAGGARVEIVREALTPAEQREVDEIDAALQRLQKGSYGHCERCGTAIGWQRLRAAPETRDCRTCSEPGLDSSHG